MSIDTKGESLEDLSRWIADKATAILETRKFPTGEVRDAIESYVLQQVTKGKIEMIDSIVHTLVFEGLNLTDAQIDSLTNYKEQLQALEGEKH